MFVAMSSEAWILCGQRIQVVHVHQSIFRQERLDPDTTNWILATCHQHVGNAPSKNQRTHSFLLSEKSNASNHTNCTNDQFGTLAYIWTSSSTRWIAQGTDEPDTQKHNVLNRPHTSVKQLLDAPYFLKERVLNTILCNYYLTKLLKDTQVKQSRINIAIIRLNQPVCQLTGFVWEPYFDQSIVDTSSSKQGAVWWKWQQPYRLGSLCLPNQLIPSALVCKWRRWKVGKILEQKLFLYHYTFTPMRFWISVRGTDWLSLAFIFRFKVIVITKFEFGTSIFGVNVILVVGIVNGLAVPQLQETSTQQQTSPLQVPGKGSYKIFSLDVSSLDPVIVQFLFNLNNKHNGLPKFLTKTKLYTNMAAVVID